MKDGEFFLYDLKVEVVGEKEGFVCSHNVGDCFHVEGENLKFNHGVTSFSMYSLAALLPLLPSKQRDTSPFDWMTTDTDIACPDPNCSARFRITRLNKRQFLHSETTVVPL